MSKFIERTAVAMGLLVAAIGVTPAHASTIYCPASDTPASGSVIQGSLQVVGGVCSADGIIVTGNVLVDPQSKLLMKNSTINGNVVSPGGILLLNVNVGGDVTLSGTVGGEVPKVCASQIGGNVSIHNVTTAPAFVALGAPDLQTNFGPVCTGNTIAGSVSANSNAGEILIEENTVGGSVNVTRNTYPYPSVVLVGNAIQHNLSCSGNTTLPGQGTNNVHGNETGQCQGF